MGALAKIPKVKAPGVRTEAGEIVDQVVYLRDQAEQRYRQSLNNIVYIIGGVFVGEKEQWCMLKTHMEKSLNVLFENNLVDDDQGLLLMSYFKNPEKYELHKMPLEGDIEQVRSILKKFNNKG